MRTPKHAPRAPFALLLVALLGGGLVLLLALNTASAANELRRHDAAAKDASIAAQVEQLQNEVAASAAPGNLASVAAQLGMVPAGNPAFLQIEPDGAVRVLGSPAAASALPLPPPASTPRPHPTKTATTPKPTGSGTPHGTSTATGTAARSSTTPVTRTPSPTPTPTTTLPGGTR